ncbi:hypothetical protein GQX74_015514 [Glossina fuscipes]|nr:hypothetical protein GQX74_015514 [Glossina fuscipes]
MHDLLGKLLHEHPEVWRSCRTSKNGIYDELARRFNEKSNRKVTATWLANTLDRIRRTIKKIEEGSSRTTLTAYTWYAEELGYKKAAATMRRLIARAKAAEEDILLEKEKFRGSQDGEKVLKTSIVDVLFELRRTMRNMECETVFEISSTATSPSTTGRSTPNNMSMTPE